MTRPLAGSRPRGKTPAEDVAAGTGNCAATKKNARTHHARRPGPHDIRAGQRSRLCQSQRFDGCGTLFPHYAPRYSLFRANCGRIWTLRCFTRLFPAGTVPVPPNPCDENYRRKMEPENGGLYAGPWGISPFSGNMDMAIAIRTMVVSQSTAYVQPVPGVYDSIPSREYDESLNKHGLCLRPGTAEG